MFYLCRAGPLSSGEAVAKHKLVLASCVCFFLLLFLFHSLPLPCPASLACVVPSLLRSWVIFLHFAWLSVGDLGDPGTPQMAHPAQRGESKKQEEIWPVPLCFLLSIHWAFPTW